MPHLLDRPPPTAQGILAVLRVLPRVSRARTALLVGGVVVSAVLPIAIAVLTGLFIGAIPEAAGAGMDSPAGDRLLTLLAAAAVLFLVERMTGPLLRATVSTLGRDVDRYLQEVVLTALGKPRGIAHLGDSAVM